MPETEDDSFSENEFCEIIVEDKNWRSLDGDINELCRFIAQNTFSLFENSNEKFAVLLCNDAKIQTLNKEWRGIDKATNVLSFEYAPNSPILGDIALSFETCAKEAKDQGKSLKNHFSHLLVHGILHLLGYDHIIETDAHEMENLEKEILGKMGIDDPYIIGGGNNGEH